MRVLSALISTFVFASAVFEHPKLFARARSIDIGPLWGGYRRTLPGNGNIRLLSVAGAFRVPSAVNPRRDREYGTLIGVRLGGDGTACDAACDACNSNILAGVLIYNSPSPPMTTYYKAVYKRPRLGSPGGEMVEIARSAVEALGPHDSIIVSYREVIFPDGRTLCRRTADWMVGTIIAIPGGRMNFAIPMMHPNRPPELSTVTFSQAQAINTRGDLVVVDSSLTPHIVTTSQRPRLRLRPTLVPGNVGSFQVQRSSMEGPFGTV